MYRGTYDSWGYSPLDQITTDNVADLVPVWSMSTGVTSGHESPPIVNDGVMFVTTPEDRVIAVNARTGEQMWLYARQFPEDMAHPHRTNRGVGLYGDKVFYTTHDAFTVALDARSGEVVWETVVADYRSGYYMTMAPLVASGKVLVGASGGERGIRGFVAALDPETGEEVWRSHTIPGPGEPGNDVAGRAGERDVAGRDVAHGRRVDLDHRVVRPGAQPHLLGHRQPGPVDRGPAAGRQPLHQLRRRVRRRYG